LHRGFIIHKGASGNRCVKAAFAERRIHPKAQELLHMLGWALTFLVIAVIAGVFGFGGIATTSAGIAQVIFVVFLILFALSLLAGLFRRT
jgi:uncharacterized membrane protein YtjA (UPF0391 family)